MNDGWKCPSCGRCYAPIVMECRWCNEAKAHPLPPHRYIQSCKCGSTSVTTNGKCVACGGQRW